MHWRWFLIIPFLLIPPKGCAFSAHAHQGKLHVVVTSDRFVAGDEQLFSQNANVVKNAILSYEPFTEFKDKIEFINVFNTVSLGCKYSSTMPRLLTCTHSVVTAVLNAAGATYDHIIVIVKSSAYGGSGGSLTVTYNGSSMAHVVVHEFGHTFGGLMDEYVLYSGGSLLNTTQRNCYAGLPPNPLWAAVGGVVYATGCKFSKWARSSPCSVMRSLSCRYFNNVSKVLIRERLIRFANSA